MGKHFFFFCSLFGFFYQLGETASGQIPQVPNCCHSAEQCGPTPASQSSSPLVPSQGEKTMSCPSPATLLCLLLSSAERKVKSLCEFLALDPENTSWSFRSQEDKQSRGRHGGKTDTVFPLVLQTTCLTAERHLGGMCPAFWVSLFLRGISEIQQCFI